MTPSPKYFSTYSSCPNNKKFFTYNNKKKRGPNKLVHNLKSFIHVPKLSINLISIQKLTKIFHVMLFFQGNFCIWEDKNSGRIIGHTREWNKLYHMEESNNLINSHSLILKTTMTSKEKTQLYNFRLGHLSLQGVKLILSSFFKNLKAETQWRLQTNTRSNYIFEILVYFT